MIKKKIVNYVILILFLIVLYVPYISFQFIGKYLEVDTSENRNLAEKPVLDFSSIKSIVRFPSQFDNYWNDHLPYRNLIKQADASIRYDWLKISPDSRVIIGKNDGKPDYVWLFYNAVKDGNPIGDITGAKVFKSEDKTTIYESITENTKKLKEKNIELYYLVVPNKSTIYSEKLPDSIKTVDKTRTDDMIEYLENANIDNAVYVKKELMEAKKTADTYYHLDTHWNNYGAFLGTKELMKRIDSDFHLFDDFEITGDTYVIKRGDLYNFININKDFYDKTIGVKNQYIVPYQTTVLEDSLRLTNNEHYQYDQCVMIIGDSYRGAIIQYFASLYKEVIHMHRNDYESAMIDKYQPDIIISVGVERYSYNVLNMDF